VVLFGGRGYGGVYFDTWEYDGTATTTPPAAQNHVLSYDSTRGLVVLFGGIDSGSTILGQTWEYRPRSGATYARFGTACRGSAGAPSLAPASGSLPWLGETFTLQFGDLLSGQPVLVFLGFSRTNWSGLFPLPVDLTAIGMNGCSLYVSGEHLDVTTSVGGRASWPLTLCRCPELLGLDFFNQAFVLDPSANVLGMIATNAGQGRTGMR